ncbi:nuclear transport factor 2 family protein, partial [Bradyrhizobium sp. NBAIM08]|uniref:nuclear transport factor 2 family protein n=1 Tax=Bradyrhizobium sp. NBAIM08 TaxID=2793815 RepID=UPI001CD2FB5F|nr:nuclear transport factor 2 family protein [Bradyrhizobium sp. NBAIM08]
MPATDPRVEALHALLRALGTLDFVRVGELIADDAVFEFPYGAGGPVRGRGEILGFLGASMAAFVSQMTFNVEAVYPAEDPELLVAEYT